MIPQAITLIDGFHAPRTGNREQWLTNVAVLLRPWFARGGYEIPVRIRLGVGALSSSRKVLGTCHTFQDRDGFRHITISPFIDDPILVAGVLIHELIHAVLPEEENHGPSFRAVAQSLGLQQPVTRVSTTSELQAHLGQVVRQVGPYPHKAPGARVDEDQVRRARASARAG